MNVLELYPDRWLRGEDVTEGTRLKVREVKAETFPSPAGPQQKVVLLFEGSDKGLILNRTSARVLAGLLGPETDGWIGATVVLGRDAESIRGAVVWAIKVRSAERAGSRS